jgi:hypothetical protein
MTACQQFVSAYYGPAQSWGRPGTVGLYSCHPPNPQRTFSRMPAKSPMSFDILEGLPELVWRTPNLPNFPNQLS